MLGRALRLRDGRDVTLISTGSMLAPAMHAAERLAADHRLECRVLSMPTLKPLDSDAVLAAARETGALITLEEHSITGGLGSAVAEVLAESGVPHGPFRRFGVPDRISHALGSQSYLRSQCGDVVELVQGACGAAAQKSRRESGHGTRDA